YRKAIAIVQCGSLVLQTIARAAAGLMITQLELMTLTFVACAVLAYAIWLDKPFNGERSQVFFGPKTKASNLHSILSPYADFPEYVSDNHHHFRDRGVRNLEIVSLLVEPFNTSTDQKEGRKDRVSRHKIAIRAFYGMGAVTSGIQLIAWDWDFPDSAA
ncbi:hypothetical protein K432DRAFT_313636, partial [Lepidopterella palustris CBS 459.81]